MIPTWHTQPEVCSSVNYLGEHGCSIHAIDLFRISFRRRFLTSAGPDVHTALLPKSILGMPFPKRVPGIN